MAKQYFPSKHSIFTFHFKTCIEHRAALSQAAVHGGADHLPSSYLNILFLGKLSTANKQQQLQLLEFIFISYVPLRGSFYKYDQGSQPENLKGNRQSGTEYSVTKKKVSVSLYHMLKSSPKQDLSDKREAHEYQNNKKRITHCDRQRSQHNSSTA